jgi:TolB-like protein
MNTSKYWKRSSAVAVSAVFILLPLLSGCAYLKNNDLITSSYEMADALITQTSPPLAPDRPLIVATFVNIDNLNESSTFGRTVAEMVASRFTLNRYTVIEMKLRNDVYIRERNGEFILSRDLKNISLEHKAQAVIAGTYSVGNNVIYVKANIIDPMTSIVRATYNFELSINSNYEKMLGLRKSL